MRTIMVVGEPPFSYVCETGDCLFKTNSQESGGAHEKALGHSILHVREEGLEGSE